MNFLIAWSEDPPRSANSLMAASTISAVFGCIDFARGFGVFAAAAFLVVAAATALTPDAKTTGDATLSAIVN